MSSDYDKEGGQPDQVAAFHALVGRALTDVAFREQLRSGGRDDALRSVGLEPTSELSRALEEAMGTVDNLAKQFGDVQAAT